MTLTLLTCTTEISHHAGVSNTWYIQVDKAIHHPCKNTSHLIFVILPFGILSLVIFTQGQINLMSTEVMKHVWVTFCNITTAVVCSAESEPFCWHFLQLTVQFSLALGMSGTGLDGTVQTEKKVSKGKCCVIGGGADTLNMLEQYSSASWDLSPVLTLLALATVSFSSWLDVLSSTADQHYPPEYTHFLPSDFHSWDFLFS